ncbi:hypothetical protein LIER_32879 [Lithospermum erythrorhizon]|uniref:Retrotransposon Copia-like N-terminal domain-containing protein n=1 Tax=Lithospermum erythrorhizon TaxID=34254 RepID=A0AAV3S0W8_LITER
MGKSPGKWIKSVLFGKKTSNSSVSKRRDIPKKSSYEKAPSAPYQASVSNVVVQPCFISKPVLVTGAAGYANSELESVRTEILAVSNAEPTLCSPKEEGDARYANNELESGRTEIIAVSNAEPTLSSPKQDGDATATLNHDVPDDSEKYRIEQAATKAQAIFRGCRARRAFRTLKGIIRLQAVIRGHLVRRQAVATLNCMLGIVKFQALVRGRIIRRLDLGSQIHAKQTLSKQVTLVLAQGSNLGATLVFKTKCPLNSIVPLPPPELLNSDESDTTAPRTNTINTQNQTISIYSQDNLKITNYILNGGNNYPEWERSVRIVVKGKGKFGYLSGTIAEPKADDPKYQIWEAENSMVMGWLIGSMEP